MTTIIASIAVVVLASLLLTWAVTMVLPSFVLAEKESDMGSGSGSSDSGSGGGSTGSSDHPSDSGASDNKNVKHDNPSDTSASQGMNENPNHIGKPDVNPSPGQTNDKNTPDKQIPDTGTTINLPNIPTTTPIVTNPITLKLNPIVPATPNKGCAFHPDDPKCKPDNMGNCPTGFSHNVHGNCFPSGKCPSGFSRHNDDETGKCFSNHNTHHPNHHIVVVVKHSSSSSSSSSHSLSGKCFDEIKIAWLGKIHRGQNHAVDQIIDKCLGIN
jgi:hypothetical protein